MTDVTAEAHLRFESFLHRAGFHPSQWSLAIDSSGQERGIRATHDITITKPATNTTPPPHQSIISIPASLLITPDRVRSSSFARSLLPAAALASLSAEQLLILWLVYQRRQGEHSAAYPYLSLLPSYYSSVEWWTVAEVQLLPRSVATATVSNKATDGEKAGQDDPVYYHRSLCSRIRAQWQQLNDLLSTHHPSLQPCKHDQPAPSQSLPLSVRQYRLPPSSHPLCPSTSHPLSCLISLAEYQWSYSTVSTRSCYWPEDGSSCLIPFLDMLNHSSHIVCTCHYNTTTRLYSLYTRDKSSSNDAAAPLLHVSGGSEVYINYGALSNWQLLVRYGFVLDENVDEKDDVSVDWLEQFIHTHCDTNGRRLTSPSPSRHSDQKVTVRRLSDVRCYCGRSLLWQSLVSLRPCIGKSAQLPHVPRFSSKHSKLLSLCGLYSPSTFSLTCCTATWDLTTYIKCRTVPLPPPAAPQPTNNTLQSWADVILNDEWVDEQHERRGRELMAAVLVERMRRGGQQDSNASLLQQLDELEPWRLKNKQQLDNDANGQVEQGSDSVSVSAGTDVSVLCRMLSVQFRVARRRMLLGALQHQLDASTSKA